MKPPDSAPQSIMGKLIRGSIWNGVSQFGSQAFNLAITVLLARMLMPADFGIFGMVAVFTAFTGYFSEFGMTAALIQKRDMDGLDVSSAFWTSAALSFGIYALMYFGAPLVSAFYRESRLTAITRVVFVTFLLTPLNFIPAVIETKKLEYGKITAAELASLFLSGSVAIVLAYAGFGVWSLVWQDIIRTGTRAAALLILTRWKPSFAFSWKRAKPLLGPGTHFTVNNLLLFAYENVDYLLVGKLLGTAPLGVYTMAFRLSKYPVVKLEGVFGKMLFPAFSSFSDDPVRIRKNFIRLLLFFSSWITPALIFGFFASDPLVRILLGEKWLVAIPLIRIFMVYLVIDSFCIQNYPIFIALKKVKIWNAMQAVSTAALAAAGYAAIGRQGILGMATAFTIVTSLFLIAVFCALVRILGIPRREILRTLRPPVLRNGAFAILLFPVFFFTGAHVRGDWLRLAVPGTALIAWLAAANGRDISGLVRKIKNRGNHG